MRSFTYVNQKKRKVENKGAKHATQAGKRARETTQEKKEQRIRIW